MFHMYILFKFLILRYFCHTLYIGLKKKDIRILSKNLFKLKFLLFPQN